MENSSAELGRSRLLRLGLQMGAIYATVFTLVAVALFVTSGGAALNHSVSRLGGVIAVYWIGGAVSGTLFGLLRPLTRWAIGAVLLGAILVAPIYAGMRFVSEGFAPWTSTDTSDVLTLSVLIGGLAGVILRHRLIKRGWKPS